MEKSRIKSRLFWAFFSYTILIFVFAFVIFLLFKRVENFEKTLSVSHQLHVSTQQTIKHGYEFFLYETTNEKFWKTQKSEILEKCRWKLREIESLSKMFSATSWVSSMPSIQFKVDSLNLSAIQYRRIYDDMLKLTWERGFRDYGLIGRFREKAHEIERIAESDITLLLQMRRHEKDYMLRGDTIYIEKFFLRFNSFKNKVFKNNKIPTIQKERLSNLLDQYTLGFDSLVKLDSKLGHRKPTGMMGKLQRLSETMATLSSEIQDKTEEEKKRIYSITRYATVSIITLSVLLMLILMVSFQFVFIKSESEQSR